MKRKIVKLRELKPGDRFQVVGDRNVWHHIRKMGGLACEGWYWSTNPTGQRWEQGYWVENPKEFDFMIVQWHGEKKVVKVEPFEPKKIELKQLKQLELW